MTLAASLNTFAIFLDISKGSFLIIEEIDKNSKLNRTRAKKHNIFLDLWENITPSLALLLKLTPICCFAIFLALARSRADPRGSRTIPSVVFFKTLCSIKLVFSSSIQYLSVSFKASSFYCFLILFSLFVLLNCFLFLPQQPIFNFIIHFSFHSSSPSF